MSTDEYELTYVARVQTAPSVSGGTHYPGDVFQLEEALQDQPRDGWLLGGLGTVAGEVLLLCCPGQVSEPALTAEYKLRELASEQGWTVIDWPLLV